MSVNMKGTIAMNFLEMAKKKDIDKITVKDLAETCNISRQCFYYHFKDIYEVMEWTVREAICVTTDYVRTADDHKEAMKILVFMILDNRDVFHRIVHSRHKEYVEKLLFQEIRTCLLKMIEYKHGKKLDDMSDNHAMQVDFCAYGICGLLLKNCIEQPIDQEKLAEQLVEVIRLLLL